MSSGTALHNLGGSLSAVSATLECPFTTDIYHDPSHSLAQLPNVVLESLPTIFHGPSPDHEVLEVADAIDDFLERDLDVTRLNAIESHLWACGRPMNARALHRQQMMGRSVVLTEQADLHLLYHSHILFLKPMPAYLLSRTTWTLHLNHNEKLHKEACGMLLSYIWLLRSPLDFKLAEKENLIPTRLDWFKWRSIVREFLSSIDPNSLDQVDKRYQFGELRLHRINTVYRITPRFIFSHFIRGYLYGYNRYKAFFQRSVGWVLVVFVWFSLILSAMQVGVSSPKLQGNQAFNNGSYGFVVFSIVLVAALVLFVGGLFILIFFCNMAYAISHDKKEAKRRKKMADERKNKLKTP